MKQGRAFASLTLCCAGALSIGSLPANAKAPGIESVKDAWQHWRAAAGRGDTQFLEKLFTPDYVSVDWHEKTQNRAEALAAAALQPKNSVSVPASVDEFIQFFGYQASVHALIAGVRNNKPQRILSTADFVFQDGRWKLFYSQQSLIADATTDGQVLPPPDARAGNTPASPGCSSSEAGPDIGAHLIHLRHKWLESEIRGDTRFLECLLAPHYSDANYVGSSRGRAALIERSQKHADPDKAIPPPVPQIATVNGDCAVVRNLWSGPLNGKEVKVWLADTFVRENGQWHAIYSQQTLVQE
jgi:hypothetical protein